MKLAKIVIQKTFLRWLLFGGLANIAIYQQAENIYCSNSQNWLPRKPEQPISRQVYDLLLSYFGRIWQLS